MVLGGPWGRKPDMWVFDGLEGEEAIYTGYGQVIYSESLPINGDLTISPLAPTPICKGLTVRSVGAGDSPPPCMVY